MKIESLPTRLTPWLVVACLCLFSFCVMTTANLLSAAGCGTCPATTCPFQPTSPPFKPCTAYTPQSIYIERYSVVGEHGAMTFIGNTLGLSKALCLNEPGTGTVGGPNDFTDAIGAFTTIDNSLQVGTYPTLTAIQTGGPAGTTLDYTKNSSSAVLNLPLGVTILYAELVWSGSFGYYCENPTTGNPRGVDPNCVLSFANGPIKFTTPDSVLHLVTADPATARESLNPAFEPSNFLCGGYYVRSANVTNLFTALSLANPNGTYTVGGVPATISGLDNTQNAAGWTLCIVYRDPASTMINNMTLFVAAQEALTTTGMPATVSGFCAAPVSENKTNVRILISAIEGDANKMGDQMLLKNTLGPFTPLFGPNNPVSNFFCSQINDDNGNLINTTGTYCASNSDPVAGNLVSGGRQGYDITNVDGSAIITPGETTAFAQATTTGDEYMVNALGIQISVAVPIIVPIKTVDGQNNIMANVGDTVTFDIVINNTGMGDATVAKFFDVLESGLMFVDGTFKVNGVPDLSIHTNAQLAAGILLGTGTIDEGTMVTVEFQTLITSRPLSGNIFHNFSTITFDFNPCDEQLVSGSNNSNVVTITLPVAPPTPPPTNFDGTVTTCGLLNKNVYSLTATWTPVPLSSVVEYRIYENGVLVATIPASGPFIFKTCLESKEDASTFTIVAVYPNNVESAPLPITIVSG